MTADNTNWKEKYLENLQRMEEQETEWETRFEMLRRSLTRTSMAAEGQDKRLDECLHELRALLLKGDYEDALVRLTPRLEKALLDSEGRKQARINQITQSLRMMAERLKAMPTAGKLRRSIKRFANRLDERVGQWAELQLLIYELESLQRQTLQELATPTQQGLWQRLFGSGHAPNGMPLPAPNATQIEHHEEIDSEEDEDEEDDPEEDRDQGPPDHNLDAERPETPQTPSEPKPRPNPAAQVPAAAESVDLAPIGPRSPATDELPIVAPKPRATPEQSQQLSPAVDLSISAGDSLGNRNLAAASLAEVTATLLEHAEATENATLHRQEPPPYSTVAERVEIILLSLLEDLYLPEEWQAQVNMLRRRIKNGLNWYELITVLEDLAALLRILPLFDHQFDDYIQELNDRLEGMQKNLERLQNSREEQRQNNQRFGLSVRDRVEGLQDSVDKAEDLQTLKQEIGDQLDSLRQEVARYQEQVDNQSNQTGSHLQDMGNGLNSVENVTNGLRNHVEEQQRKAHQDALTGLPNRIALTERLEKDIQQWKQKGGYLLLAVLDVDHFKSINDTYGHLAGDRVLKILAHRWRDSLREQDFLARYGGEEFVLLMPDTHPEQGFEVLDQLRKDTEECPFHFKGERLVITVSAGFATFTRDLSAEDVFERADQALYRAKHGGRNRVECGI